MGILVTINLSAFFHPRDPQDQSRYSVGYPKVRPAQLRDRRATREGPREELKRGARSQTPLPSSGPRPGDSPARAAC